MSLKETSWLTKNTWRGNVKKRNRIALCWLGVKTPSSSEGKIHIYSGGSRQNLFQNTKDYKIHIMISVKLK